jgi:putative ABC transport system permease protein
MKIKYLIKISLRNLSANRLRTVLTLSGVIIGIAAIVFLVSLGFGLQRLVTSEVATMEQMGIIDITTGESKIVELNDDSKKRIEGVDNIDQVASMVNIAARIYYQSSAIDGVVYGTDSEYLELGRIKVDSGQLFSSQEADEVIVNRATLNLLGLEKDQADIVGQNLALDLIIPADLLGKDKEKKVIEGRELTVVGVIETDTTPFVYVPLELLKKEGVKSYSTLKAEMTDRHQVEGIREAVENMGYKTDYIGDTVSQINQIFDIFKVVMASFGAVALIVASLGMFNTLMISLLERIKEVGLLKTLGMKVRDINRLFLSEALLIGVSGGITGLIFGYLVGILLNYIMNIVALSSGAEPITFFFTPWYFAVGIGLFSVVIGLITGFYPARRAVKTNALDALRYE